MALIVPERWARAVHDRAAVVDGDHVLTYGEWNERADRLAHALQAISPTGRRVCVLLRSRVEWFVINLALAKLGRMHVAVSAREPETEQVELVRGCGADVVFTDGPGRLLVEWALGAAATVVTLDAPADGAVPWSQLMDRPSPVARESRRDAPIAAFTSGTTGRPRLILPPARRTAAGPTNAPTQLRLHDEHHHRALQTLPLHHGAASRGARMCHSAGGTCYLLDRFDPVAALELIDRHRITHWSAVPTMLARLRALGPDVLPRYDTTSVRMVAVGAGTCAPELKTWILERFGECLYEGYGSTETGMIALLEPRQHASHPGSCGQVLPGATVRAVDAAGREVAVDVEGELHVRTARTRSRTPDGACSPDGFFRTGDVGRVDADGFVYLSGRVGDVIIRGGENIAARQIEEVLEAHPDGAAAAVIAVHDDDLGEDLAAFCQLAPGAGAGADDLRRWAAERLAAFKAPSLLSIVDSLPRDELGKIRKQELRPDGVGSRRGPLA